MLANLCCLFFEDCVILHLFALIFMYTERQREKRCMNSFRVRIDQLQPSQPFLSRVRLENIMRNTAFLLRPVGVRELNGRLCVIEGHERLMALHNLGTQEVEVYIDDSERDAKIWKECVEICITNGIATITDLEDRFLSPSGFRQLWLERKKELKQKAG